MRALKSPSVRLLPALVLLAALALKGAAPALLEEPQLKVFDLFQRWRPRPYRPAPVLIVDLDDETLSRVGQWPWPRTRVARLVERLGEAGAAAIAFDIVFAEPDRTSPARVLEAWPPSPELEPLRQAAGGLPDHDRILAEAVARAPVVTGFALVERPGGRAPALKVGMAHAGPGPGLFAPTLPGAVTDLPELETAAAGNGHFNMTAERDGILRRVPLLFRRGQETYPSLVLEAVRVAQGASAVLIRSVPTGITGVKVGAVVIPTDGMGRLWLYDSGHEPRRFLPAWKALAGDFDPLQVEGKILFVGSSAAGLKDLRATPLNPVSAGTEVHAQLAEQILAGDYLRRPDWAPGAEWLFLLLLGGTLVLLIPRVGPGWCALLGAGAVGAAIAGSWALFARGGLLLDPVLPSLAALAIYLTGSLIQFLRTERERRQVRQAFGMYMAPALVKRLAEHPEQLKLGGEMKEMTILFADIRGFTTLSERFDAQGLTRFINRFLTPMTGVILDHQGTIDKYIGDCIMAFWNAPLDDRDHARHAAQAALGMRRALVEWGRQNFPLRIGMGINTGECCVGNMGSEQRFDYSVLGDSVNLASRLEGLCKLYGVDIVVGEETLRRVGEQGALELDLITVKGKSRPSRVYTLAGGPEIEGSPAFQALRKQHLRMLSAYRAQRWDEAAAVILEELLRMETPEVDLKELYALYQERIRAFRAAPPAAGWDGVFIAASK